MISAVLAAGITIPRRTMSSGAHFATLIINEAKKTGWPSELEHIPMR
jgi:hypothetical protein